MERRGGVNCKEQWWNLQAAYFVCADIFYSIRMLNKANLSQFETIVWGSKNSCKLVSLGGNFVLAADFL